MKIVYGQYETHEEKIKIEYDCALTGEIVELEVDYPSLYKLIQVESISNIKIWYRDGWRLLVSNKQDYYENMHAEVRIADKIKGSKDNENKDDGTY